MKDIIIQTLDYALGSASHYLTSDTILSNFIGPAAIILIFAWLAVIFLDVKKVRVPNTHETCGKTFVQGRKETDRDYRVRMMAHYKTCV